MSGKPNPDSQSMRVLGAIRSGCRLVADIEAELDFKMTRKHIAAHVSCLKQQGRVVKVGDTTLVENGRRYHVSSYVTREESERMAGETK